MLLGSKLPKYAAMKMFWTPMHAVFVSMFTHCVAPVVLVNV